MNRQNFMIEYTVKDKNGNVLKKGKVRVKNKMSEIDAQVKFEDHLKIKYKNFGQLIVHKCYPDNPFGNLFGQNGDLGDIFGDLFK